MREGKNATLCTVLSTWGGAPFPPGTIVAFCEDKQISGSLSGGCIEKDLLEYIGENNHQVFTIRSYGDNNIVKIPCGGKLDILLESISDINSISQLLLAIEDKKVVKRIVDIKSRTSKIVEGDEYTESKIYDGRYVTRIFGPIWQLIIVGAGEIARFVAEMALNLNYKVIMCEPREEYFMGWSVEGVELDKSMPDDVVLNRVKDCRTAVVTLSHDPKLDDMALMEALNSQAFYVGALGSRKTNQERCKRLRQLDVAEKDILRLHGPIGISIGSQTALQIAISILAELIKEQNKIVQNTGISER